MNEVLAPETGELVDLSKLATDEIAVALERVRYAESDIRSWKRALSDEIAARLDHEGRRSAGVGQFKVTVNPPTEKQWHTSQLSEVLNDLVSEGLISDHKRRKCIVSVPKVAWSEVKTLLSDPRLKDRIEPCFEEIPTSRYVKVDRGYKQATDPDAADPRHPF